jgi:hypothetical protein
MSYRYDHQAWVLREIIHSRAFAANAALPLTCYTRLWLLDALTVYKMRL